MRKQMSLNLCQGRWGGRRDGSGRKRVHSPGVAHRQREKVSARTPVHINFKYRSFIKNKQCLKLLKKAIINARRHGLRILHYSMQTNHLHFIIEADSNAILTKGMRSLTVTFAKGLHKGRVQLGRYHLHVLKTVAEARHAIGYVLFNQQRHEKGIYSQVDGYSSLLLLKDALTLVRNFAKDKSMMIKIESIFKEKLDPSTSFLARHGLRTLILRTPSSPSFPRLPQSPGP